MSRSLGSLRCRRGRSPTRGPRPPDGPAAPQGALRISDIAEGRTRRTLSSAALREIVDTLRIGARTKTGSSGPHGILSGMPLDFLQSIPELSDLDPSIREEPFRERMVARGLHVWSETSEHEASYTVLTDTGENVIVM